MYQTTWQKLTQDGFRKRAKSIKLLSENKGINLQDLGLGSSFIDNKNTRNKRKNELDSNKQYHWVSEQII